MIANLSVFALIFGALFLFTSSSDTNYLICASILFAAAYLKQNDDQAHDKLVGALFDIEDRMKQ